MFSPSRWVAYVSLARREAGRETIRRFLALLEEYTPWIEHDGGCRAYLELGGMRRIFGHPFALLSRIQSEIARRGLPTTAGLAANKSLSRAAADSAAGGGAFWVFPQGEKEDLLSMIGMEFSMRASFEEEGLSLAMYEEGQSESLADRVPFSLKGGVLTATVDQDESTTRMSGVIFLKRTRLAMTGVVEIQLSPPNHEDVALTLVIKMDLTKEVTSMGVPSFKTNRTA